MTNVYGIYGASGCGRSIMPLAKNQINTFENLYFIDDGMQGCYVNGCKVISYNDFISVNADNHYIAIAIADSNVREFLANKILFNGCIPWNISAENVVIMDDVNIAQGALLSPSVVITSNITIGKFFHGNIASYIEHDCVIGDFVTFAPRVSCNGNVIIEDSVYIGAGAVIKQGTPNAPLIIGKKSIVGMGSVVTKSIPSGVTVVGNPARIMYENNISSQKI